MEPDDRRGVALIIAVAVLTAMFLMAVPFAVFMRLQHSAGTQALHTARARNGYTGALGYARNVLYQGLPEYEDGTWVANPMFPFDDSDVDTPWEFRATMRTMVHGTELSYADADDDGWDDVAERTFGVKSALGLPNDGDPDTLDGYLRVGQEWVGYYHVDIDTEVGQFPGGTVTVRRQDRGEFGSAPDSHGTGTLVSVFPELEMWHLDVQDQQALINVNTAPYQVILNLLQYLEIAGPAPPDTPSVEQVNLAAAISSYRLYYSFWEGKEPLGSIEDGTYTRFQNLSAVRNISKARWLGAGGTPTLTADDFDRLRPYLTVHSEAPGELWWDVTYTQGDLNGAAPHTEYWAARLNDAGQIPVGSIVRLGDSQDDPVRMVSSVNRNLTLSVLLGSGADKQWVPVGGDLSDFALMGATTAPGSTAHTPGYLYIEDGVDSEWIAYSDVDASAGQIYISERGLWGTSPADHDGAAGSLTMRGNVIGWRYDDGTGGSSDTDADSYTPAVPDDEEVTDGTTVQLERRHAVNVNTVTDPVILQALFYGVADEVGGTDYDISAAEAGDLARSLLAYKADGTAPSSPATEPPYDFFGGDEIWFDLAESDWVNYPGTGTDSDADLQDFFDTKCVGAGIITSDEAGMLVRNFKDIQVLKAAGADWPAVSTCPLRFNSGELTGIASMGMADDRAYTPVAQYPRLARSRVYDTVPPLEGLIWTLRSQEEFYDWMALSGQREADGGHILSGGLLERLPGPLLMDDADWDNPDEGMGTVMPALGILASHRYVTCLMGLHSPTVNDFDLDYSAAADTAMVGTATADTDNTTCGGMRDVQLEYATHYDAAAGNRHIEADSFHAVVQPFAVEFWMRPARDVLNRQLILDLGEGEAEEPDAESQVRLYLQSGRLVLRMDEPVYKRRAGYGGYVRAVSGFTIEPGEWHYVAVAAVGPFKHEIAMFVDGIYDHAMTWRYVYEDQTEPPQIQEDDETAVEEGCFLPLAMTWPNRNTTATIGPVGGEWATGSSVLGVEDKDWLPERGCVVVSSAAECYPYQGFGTVDLGGGTTVDVLLLGKALEQAHGQGDPVALALPLTRETAHKGDMGSYNPPTNQVTLYWHENLGSGSYTIEGESELDIGTVVKGADYWADWMADVLWAPIEPGEAGGEVPGSANSPLGPDAGASLSHADRYKALGHRDAGVLAGALPTGPIGDTFSMGGARDGFRRFEGELDEVRITPLPLALVQGEDAAGNPVSAWSAGATEAQLQRWRWYGDGDLGQGATSWNRLDLEDGVRYDMHTDTPLNESGGYFIVDGEICGYRQYVADTGDPDYGKLKGIHRVYRDLRPQKSGGAFVTGLQDAHARLRRVIPLSFLTVSTLAANYNWGDDDIPLTDASQFPNEGYVIVGSEIIAYDGKSGDTLLRPAAQAELRRGCYDTEQVNHPAGALVRALPVRYLDRYRGGTDWTQHQTYSDGELGRNMCMFKWTLSQDGSLSGVWWRLKNALQDGQRLAVLVAANPDLIADTDGDSKIWSDDPDEQDDMWGAITIGGQQAGVLWPGGVPVTQAGGGVEVRFHYDLSETDPYNIVLDTATDTTNRGWTDMIELDEVGIQMTPEAHQF